MVISVGLRIGKKAFIDKVKRNLEVKIEKIISIDTDTQDDREEEKEMKYKKRVRCSSQWGK